MTLETEKVPVSFNGHLVEGTSERSLFEAISHIVQQEFEDEVGVAHETQVLPSRAFSAVSRPFA